eukprot:1373770-Amphidinium_carterae.1
MRPSVRSLLASQSVTVCLHSTRFHNHNLNINSNEACTTLNAGIISPCSGMRLLTVPPYTP